MRWISFVCIVGALGVSPFAYAEPPITVRDLQNNLRVRLVKARFSEHRGRHLIAQFQAVEG